MEASPRYRLVIVTAPVPIAESLASTLVEERLVACVNIVPGVISIYRWQGRLEREAEALLLMKTDESHLDLLEQRVKELHPYDVPEVIAVPLAEGNGGYLRWLDEGLSPGPG
ncbi:MAG: divalent-cation tolerance protein CutA [Anaerolineae bacterium]